jgi:hypothetical protein
MRAALVNIDLVVRPGGRLFVAVNNESHRLLEGTSRFWERVKSFYDEQSQFVQRIMERTYGTAILAGVTLTGKNPLRHIREYRSERGMDFWTDVRNWLAEHPYEYASASDVAKLYDSLGYSVVNQTQARALGCNQFLLLKEKA